MLHGAEKDIEWLQRDFGVYIVGLFDTYHASHLLEMEEHSYASLLRYFCDVETDKKFQRADWTKRPLSEAMKLYAITGNHDYNIK